MGEERHLYTEPRYSWIKPVFSVASWITGIMAFVCLVLGLLGRLSVFTLWVTVFLALTVLFRLLADRPVGSPKQGEGETER